MFKLFTILALLLTLSGRCDAVDDIGAKIKSFFTTDPTKNLDDLAFFEFLKKAPKSVQFQHDLDGSFLQMIWKDLCKRGNAKNCAHSLPSKSNFAKIIEELKPGSTTDAWPNGLLRMEISISKDYKIKITSVQH